MKEEARIEVNFQSTIENKDVIIALLADIEFDSFDESDNTLKAFIEERSFDENELKTLAQEHSLHYTINRIQPRNWNAVWESNFEPVIIDDFVAVRADFHQPIPNVAHEIVITPKMSFGTGHHATTTMMVQQMRDINFSGKDVFDFGTGTGILAILAAKLGAETVFAIDNDSWSIENSQENFERNGCLNIRLELHDHASVNGSFDIILANINRNVILESMAALNNSLNPNGYLLLSGLLIEDEAVILEEAKKYTLVHKNMRQLGQWISLLFSR